MKLVIATPFYSMSAFSPYLSSLMTTVQMLDRSGTIWDFWNLSGDSYVDRARNNLCARFLKSDFTHLLFIDSDMSWNLQGIMNLLSSPFDLTGGIYPCKNKWDEWTESLKYDSNHAPVQEQKTGLIEVDWLPAGFMLVTKNCIETMVEAYKEDWYWNNNGMDGDKTYNLFECRIIDHVRQGEDVLFCKKWAALGKKIYCEPRINFGHTGMKTYEGNFHEHLLEICEKQRIFTELKNVEGASNGVL